MPEAISVLTPAQAPRDPSILSTFGRYQLVRLGSDLGMFPDENARAAFMSKSTPDMVAILIPMLQQFDAQGGAPAQQQAAPPVQQAPAGLPLAPAVQTAPQYQTPQYNPSQQVQYNPGQAPQYTPGQPVGYQPMQQQPLPNMPAQAAPPQEVPATKPRRQPKAAAEAAGDGVQAGIEVIKAIRDQQAEIINRLQAVLDQSASTQESVNKTNGSIVAMGDSFEKISSRLSGTEASMVALAEATRITLSLVSILAENTLRAPAQVILQDAHARVAGVLNTLAPLGSSVGKA